MMLVPVAVLWAWVPLLTWAEPPPVTVTVAVGEDACLPCATQPWGPPRGVTLTCTHHISTHPPTLVLRHRLGWDPPTLPGPGWDPPEQPGNRYRDRVSFCAPGHPGVSLLLRNVTQPDFGNYSCSLGDTDPPRLLCSLILQPPEEGVPKSGEPDMLLVVGILTGAFTAVAIGILVGCRCGRGCSQHPARESGTTDEGGGGGGTAVPMGDLKPLGT